MADTLFCSECGHQITTNDEICPYCFAEIIDNIKDEKFKQAWELYMNGDSNCLNLFQQSADNGYTLALLRLGIMYLSGDLVDKDYKTAYKYFHQALQNGDKRALGYIGNMVFSKQIESNSENALSILLEFNRYYPMEWRGLLNIGRCYAKGNGTNVDYNLAKEYLRKAKEIVPENVFVIWHYALVLEKLNDPESVIWYKKAFDLGDLDSGLSLGCLYSEGNLVKSDFNYAITVFDKVISMATEQDDAEILRLATKAKRLCIDKMNISEAENKNDRINQLLGEGRNFVRSQNNSAAINKFFDVASIEPNNVEAKFFLSYLNCVDVNADNASILIDRMKSNAQNVISEIASKNNEYDKEYYAFVCNEIAVYTAKFTLGVSDVHFTKAEEMLSYHSSIYNRYGATSFIDNVILPSKKEMAMMLYWIGDNIERIFPNGEAANACKTAWEYGNLHMKYCAEHGGIFNKIELNNTIRYYKQKISRW